MDLLDDPVTISAVVAFQEAAALKVRKGLLITTPHQYDPEGVDIVGDGALVAERMRQLVREVQLGEFSSPTRNRPRLPEKSYDEPAVIRVGGKTMSEPVRTFIFPTGYKIVWQHPSPKLRVTVAALRGESGVRVTFCLGRRKGAEVWEMVNVIDPNRDRVSRIRIGGLTCDEVGLID